MMNNKKRKLAWIRHKNRMRKQGLILTKFGCTKFSLKII